MSAGEALPRQVFGHGWVHFKGEKMSKSLGTAVDPLEAADRLGADPLRLYLVKEVPYGGDGDFSWERFEERYNADLANNLGNLVSRIASMAERYVGGTRRRRRASRVRSRRSPAETLTVVSRGDGRATRCTTAPAAVYRLISAANEYIAQTEPWTLAKQPDQARPAEPGALRRGRGGARRRRAAAADHARRRLVKYCAGSARPPTRRRCASIATPPGGRPASARS